LEKFLRSAKGKRNGKKKMDIRATSTRKRRRRRRRKRRREREITPVVQMRNLDGG
tara:strand:- start:209 stop:373 length:165 start_codon:yes stop_codon:yes gene_type:complete